MSAALYNQDGQWGIPGYIWPAVLGTSVAVHLSILLYGLPDMAFLQDKFTPETETEVIIESGGLTFERVSAIEAVPSETPDPAAPPAVTPLEAERLETPAETVPVRPAQSAALQPVKTEAVRPETPQTATIVKAQDATVDAVKGVPPQDVQTEDVQPVEPVPVANPPVAKETASTVVTAVPSASVSLPGVSPSVSTVAPTVSVKPVTGAGVAVTTIETPPVSSPVTVSPTGIPVTAPAAQKTALQPVQNIAAVSPSASQQATGDVAVATAVAQTPDPVNVVAQPVAPSSVPPSATMPVTSASTATAAVQDQTGTAQAVKPLEQQVAALRPAEEEVTAIAPSRPEASSVPAAPATSDPAESVPAAKVASIDPLAKVTDYVSGYDAGGCSHLSVLSAGPDSAAVTAYGAGIAPFAIFDQRFAADQGYEAKVEVRLVTRQQCALLDALGLSEGIEAAGLVELDRTVVQSGASVSGVIQRDLPLDRIAAAETAGVRMNGKGPPELYLIDDGGQIHDGRDYILPASNAATAGGWRFSVPVTLLSKAERETALVLAIWNRPAASQPARFGTLAPSRIADILAAPGVYSLSAFKVSR